MNNAPQHQDLTGRNRLAYNVIIGWLGQLVFVASGFILPRMIDANLGKETLGIWDLAWSLISYFDFIFGGLITSVNRYVAKFRAIDNVNGINTAVNSAFVILLFIAALIAILASCSFIWLPHFMQGQLSAQTTDAQWVICYLGLGQAIKICLAIFGGILTGCHRWDLQHGINAANRLITLAGMMIVLACGGGLPILALVYTCLETLVLSSRCTIVFRICPGLIINPRLARRNTAQAMWHFGIKTLLPDIGDLLSNQTFNLFLVWFLGPAALASYARPKALVNNIQTFARRYALTLTSTASSLQAMADKHEMQRLFIRSCQTGSYIVFPMVAVLTIMGGPILQIWMGQEYNDDLLPAILALSYLPFLLQLPLNSLLQGFNSHGWPGLFKFIAAITGIGCAYTMLSFFHASTIKAAIALFIPFWISEFIITPSFAAKRHHFSLKEYWLTGIFRPLLVMVPMIACLLTLRVTFAAHPLKIVLTGVPLSLFCFALAYWFFGASSDTKKKLISVIQSSKMFNHK
jgi:O-antigen/teichoic acid export membrane protein